MALSGKLEVVYELKSSPEKFYGFWRTEPHGLLHHSPQNYNHVHVDWNPDASQDAGLEKEDDAHQHIYTVTFHYIIKGKDEVLKMKVKSNDDKMTIVFTGVEGDVMNFYKVFKEYFYIIRNESKSFLKYVAEYECHDETIPPPYEIFDLVIGVIKDVDKGHLN